jgi:hypothetical protein
MDLFLQLGKVGFILSNSLDDDSVKYQTGGADAFVGGYNYSPLPDPLY